MADLADMANQVLENFLDEAVRLREQTTGLGPSECIQCGDAMIKERRELGLRLCFECATEKEKLSRR